MVQWHETRFNYILVPIPPPYDLLSILPSPYHEKLLSSLLSLFSGIFRIFAISKCFVGRYMVALVFLDWGVDKTSLENLTHLQTL